MGACSSLITWELQEPGGSPTHIRPRRRQMEQDLRRIKFGERRRVVVEEPSVRLVISSGVLRRERLRAVSPRHREPTIYAKNGKSFTLEDLVRQVLAHVEALYDIYGNDGRIFVTPYDAQLLWGIEYDAAGRTVRPRIDKRPNAAQIETNNKLIA